MHLSKIDFPFPLNISKLCLIVVAKMVALCVLHVCGGNIRESYKWGWFEKWKRRNGFYNFLELEKWHQWTIVSFLDIMLIPEQPLKKLFERSLKYTLDKPKCNSKKNVQITHKKVGKRKQMQIEQTENKNKSPNVQIIAL